MARAAKWFLFISVIGLLCGCETTGAFGTGRITEKDVNSILHEGTIGRRYANVDVNTVTPDEDYDADSLPVTSWSQTLEDLYYADSKLEEYLW